MRKTELHCGNCLEIKPIISDSDYQSALEHVYTVMESDEGSSEANERDALLILIEKYEEEHFPMDLPSPVESIQNEKEASE